MFTKEDGPRLVSSAAKMAKKRNPVYLEKQGEDFTVQTNEGILLAHAGDYLAHDPISGHVWPVAPSYVDQHYEAF